jgi:hypothetical protein
VEKKEIFFYVRLVGGMMSKDDEKDVGLGFK